MSKLKVLILFGGVSSEHEVSCVSAASVVDSLNVDKYDIIKIGISKKGRWLYHPGSTDMMRDGTWERSPDTVSAFIAPDRILSGIFKQDIEEFSFQKIDVVFPVLHGKNGEDGTVQGLLRLAGIPFVGCDVAASAICMDKEFTNSLLVQRGLPHCKYEVVSVGELERYAKRTDEIVKEFGLPIFVKPANAGSSVGITKVDSAEALFPALLTAAAHDGKILIEEAVKGKEIECAVLGTYPPFVSVPGEIEPQADFYDYNAKYKSGQGGLYVPARIDEDTTRKVRDLAAKAFTVLGCEGYARVDFFVTEQNDIYINEINTIPGFTDISMFPRLMAATGLPYDKLLDRLIELALEHRDE